MNLPPLSALVVLDALARTGSVRGAAQTVHLSQSAVSHKLKTLEATLGFRLTKTQGRGVALTSEAQRYVAAIRPALETLRDAHNGMGQAKGSLDIAVTSGFAATWLAPRLRDFHDRFPDISVRLRSVAMGEGIRFSTAPYDVAITFTDTPPENAEHLFEVKFFPVCSPDFLHRHPLKTPKDISSQMLLHLDSTADWQHWLEACGASSHLEHSGTGFTGVLAMYAAAEAGLGLCLGDAVTVDRALQTGRLLRPFPTEIAAPASYWLVPDLGGLTAPASAFCAWLRGHFQPSTSIKKP